MLAIWTGMQNKCRPIDKPRLTAWADESGRFFGEKRRREMLVRRVVVTILFVLMNVVGWAQSPVIVRDTLGLSGLRITCVLLRCTINTQIDGPGGVVFLITSPSGIPLQTFLQTLVGQLGIVDAEADRLL